MHPKHKKKATTNGSENGNENNGAISEAERKRRMFPGLSLPDQEPSAEKDVFMKEVDDMMAQLEGARKKKKESEKMQESRAAKRQRRSRSRTRSPRRSASPPRGRRDREDRYNGRSNDRGRNNALDGRPVLYKIYNGRVQTLKDFGAFVQIEGVVGRVEGLIGPSPSSLTC